MNTKTSALSAKHIATCLCLHIFSGFHLFFTAAIFNLPCIQHEKALRTRKMQHRAAAVATTTTLRTKAVIDVLHCRFTSPTTNTEQMRSVSNTSNAMSNFSREIITFHSAMIFDELTANCTASRAI